MCPFTSLFTSVRTPFPRPFLLGPCVLPALLSSHSCFSALSLGPLHSSLLTARNAQMSNNQHLSSVPGSHPGQARHLLGRPSPFLALLLALVVYRLGCCVLFLSLPPLAWMLRRRTVCSSRLCCEHTSCRSAVLSRGESAHRCSCFWSP